MEIDPGRAARAAIALSDGYVRITPDGEQAGVYVVSSFSGNGTYRVRLGPESSCTCADATFHAATCKHQVVLALHQGFS